MQHYSSFIFCLFLFVISQNFEKTHFHIITWPRLLQLGNYLLIYVRMCGVNESLETPEQYEKAKSLWIKFLLFQHKSL